MEARIIEWGLDHSEGSHIDWRRERVPVRMLGPEGGVDYEILHRLGRTKSSL